MMTKKYCSITVDVDTVTSLFPHLSFSDNSFSNGMLRFLDLFDEFDIKCTFFIVGKDLNSAKNSDILLALLEKGHEIANHTMNHIQGFSRLSGDEKVKEILEMEKRVFDSTGSKIVGFRAPGWNIDNEALEILNDNGYLYDSSIFPNILIPLFKMFYKLKTRGLPENNRITMGSILNIFKDPKINKLSFLQNKENSNIGSGLYEYPVTVTPLFRIPFIGTTFFEFGLGYFNLFYNLVKYRQFINIELHLAELLDRDNDFDNIILDSKYNTSYIPKVLSMPIDEKFRILREVFSRIKVDYEFATMKDAVNYANN